MLGVDALSKKEELISALHEHFPLSEEHNACAEKARELDGMTVNQLKAILRHFQLLLWQRLTDVRVAAD